ncbi:hypothetical protein FHS61_001283 [Altererythrobacter atlanticus]|uniref:Uncharacterized protein n=1 Tax=Croceibacterium atlanticum TaxID=1267766 RepID=A0A0F7KW79_9SPHN|nr:hypothetical protein [Croceibacterium atlanticum]AKH43969.1 hypothetical protein WYH_02943 [Croceibacterium atlanticum]MBB5732274.1 hypothetical protein [Croceibacterium atlanticum]
MGFWRNVSPSGAVADFVSVWRDNPHRWRVLAVSIAATTGLMMLFIPESQLAEPPRPKITYITTFDPERTEQEIIASNLENQKRKEELEARLAEAEERRKDMYRALGRATGLDVDAMEEEIAREQAAEEAAREAAAPPPPETGIYQETPNQAESGE